MTAAERIDTNTAKTRAAEAIDSLDARLREISLSLHKNPELRFEEHHAHALLTVFLEEQGFLVRRGAYDMPTAFEAITGSGHPVIAILCEYDALPGIGHACGHNLIAIAGAAAAVGAKAGLGDGNGTLVVLGSPAEEGGGGKILLLERGAFQHVEAAMMVHPSTGDSPTFNSTATQRYDVEYFGHNAHAGASPWQGVNALDALVAAYVNISHMRQQLRPTERVHGIFTKTGEAPNIIPDHTAGRWAIRASNMRHLEQLDAKIRACFEAAALATGCRVEITLGERPYANMVTNDVMAQAYIDNLARLKHHIPPLDKARQPVGGATDMGNVSLVLPAIHPMVGIPTEAGGANHTPGFTAAAATPGAHAAAIRAAKGLAFTALDLFLTEGTLAAATAEFRKPGDR
ncbi:MAG TPA: M20 family metallopeptidase [Tepidiformaceae bacterium]|nr:M20 family metallopeptidase [Tepidiformaceae bacterium]